MPQSLARLIDANALHDTVEWHVTSVSVCMTAEQAKGQTDFKRRCLEDIDNAPTINAIPVEWLKAQNTSTEYYKTVQGQAVELVLELWQKEQEAR